MFLARHYSLPLLAKGVTAVSLQRNCSWDDDKGWISAGPGAGGRHWRTVGFTALAGREHTAFPDPPKEGALSPCF